MLNSYDGGTVGLIINILLCLAGAGASQIPRFCAAFMAANVASV